MMSHPQPINKKRVTPLSLKGLSLSTRSLIGSLLGPPRRAAALSAGRLAGAASRRLGRGGGTALPGLVSLTLAPNLFPYLAGQLPQGYLLISGTNGKTTTSQMAATILSRGGLAPLANATGSNLLRGLTTTLLEQANRWGWLNGPENTIGLFEVDEAVLSQITAQLTPRVVVLNNLFRDQLDRYGEMDRVATLWGEALERLEEGTTVLLNADDPLVASLGRHLRARVGYFGIEDETAGEPGLEHAADSRRCPDCGGDLDYTISYYGHLGHYRCPKCGFERPHPQLAAGELTLRGLAGTDLTLVHADSPLTRLRLGLPGRYNVYNALAAASIGLALGLPMEAITSGLEEVGAAFGRAERLDFEGRCLHLMLAKNPAGLNETLRTLGGDGQGKTIVFILNDQIADGRDVSWIWDVDFESRLGSARCIIASGRRAEDMALRLKYAGVGPGCLVVERNLARALRRALAETAPGENLFVLPTYTAMLQTRQLLGRWGLVTPYWEGRAAR